MTVLEILLGLMGKTKISRSIGIDRFRNQVGATGIFLNYLCCLWRFK